MLGSNASADYLTMSTQKRNMFTRHDMMQPLIEAVPAYLPYWQLCIDGWEGKGHQDTPVYLGLSMLADQLIFALEEGDTVFLRSTFAVVERWLTEGDDYVKNATAVGLFEDLYEADRYSTCGIDEMQAWLAPVSRVWWDEING